MPTSSGRLSADSVVLDGQVYASPIIVHGIVIVATEHDIVYGLDLTGGQRWKVRLGTPTPRAKLPCGNIDPLGITGTPIYDDTTGLGVRGGLDRRPGQPPAVRAGPGHRAQRWQPSVDLPGADPQAMQQRGALAIAGGRVWVPFGGLAGDCGDYKGRLVGVPPANGDADLLHRADHPGGRHLDAAGPDGDRRRPAGRGRQRRIDRWARTTSVTRCCGCTTAGWSTPSRRPPGQPTTPAIWTSARRARRWSDNRWIFQAGKSGTGYVLAADRLGGIGGQVWQGPVCRSFGGTAVVGDTVYVPCTDGVRAVRIDGSGQAGVRWHAPSTVAGSPVVGGGRVYAVDQDAGALVALDPAHRP